MSIIKVVFRISLILAAALLVVGATLALSHTNLGAQVLSARGGLEDGLRNAAATMPASSRRISDRRQAFLRAGEAATSTGQAAVRWSLACCATWAP
jgi:hypothetical protein